MRYGNTYENSYHEESPEKTLVQRLVEEAGYNREHFDGIEIETKIDFYGRKLLRPSKDNFFLEMERFNLPSEYVRDKSLEEGCEDHEFYAGINREEKTVESAFVKVGKGNSVRKIKFKGETEITEVGGVYLLKRTEKHIIPNENELTHSIVKIIRESLLPIVHAGTIHKYSKEGFVFNHLTGRIFALSSNFCLNGQANYSPLCQLEVEYYGQINQFKSLVCAEDELIDLTGKILKKLPKHLHPRASKLTKLEWLVNQDKQFRHYRVL